MTFFFFFLLQVVTMLACSIVTVAEERTADSTGEFLKFEIGKRKKHLLQVIPVVSGGHDVDVAIATVSSDHHHYT
jgi:hypothetical protein